MASSVKLIAAGVAAAVLVIGTFASFHYVPPGHVGVVKTLNGVDPKPMAQGTSFTAPWNSIHNFNVRFQHATATKAVGGTSDGQAVQEDITLNYDYDPKDAPYIYDKFGSDTDIETSFIVPALYESFKAVTSNYSAPELLTKRSQVSADIVRALTLKLAKYHILVSDINVQNFDFNPEYQHSIERKVIATQDQERAIILKQTTQIETDQRVIEAEGRAKASAIEAKSLQEQGGDKFIQLEAIKKWDGHLPSQYSGGPMPFVNVMAAGGPFLNKQ